MAYNIQQQVDAYETMGLGALQNMQQKNPKLLVGIALENLQKDMQEQQRAKQMAAGGVGPTVIDKKLMGLAGAGVGMGQQQAMATAAPGLQMRGRQIQADQMRKAMAPQPQPMRMARGGVVGYKDGGTPTPGAVPPKAADPQDIIRMADLYRQAQASLKAATNPEDKAKVQEILNDLKTQMGDQLPFVMQYLDSTKGIIEPRTQQMARGGVVGYVPGGRVTADDVDMEDLLTALMIAESGGDPRAVSAAGAEGAYQIMPSTAENPGFGVNPMEGSRFDPEASRKFARDYLQAMIDRYDGDIEAALIAYNAGAGNADKFVAGGRDYDVLPQTMQTQPYVSKIMSQLERGVQEPTPGLIASRQTARKARDFFSGAGDFITGLFDETEATKQRRREQEEFNRLVRARNEAIRTGEDPRAAIESVRADMEDEQEAERRAAMEGFTPEEEAAGGMGYLQYLARRQREEQERKDREAKAAAGYLRTMQNQEDMISKVNPATNLSGVDLRQDFSTERSIKSPAQRMEEAFPGAREAAGRYALDKAAGLAALSDYAPQTREEKIYAPGVGGDLAEIRDYLGRVLGFQEGGQIKNFQEGDLVEADGEQVIPLSSISDDPGFVERGLQLLKDNPDVALTLGLMVIPGLGPGLSLGRLAASRAAAAAARRFGPQATRGLASLRRAGSRVADSPLFSRPRRMPKDFKIEDPTLLTKAGKPTTLRGRKGFEAATQPRAAVERIPGAPRTRRGKRIGGRNPDIRRASPARGPLISARQFSPGRTLQTAGAGYLASRGLAGLLGDDEVEAARQPTPQEMFGSAVFQREDAPPVMFRAGDTNTQRRQESRGGGQGILSRLGSALTSDKAQQLYSAFQDLGLAGGASRGFEGAQLISALTQRDLAEREAAARDRALDIDQQQLQLTSDIARSELIENLINSSSFDIVRQDIAEEMGLPRESSEVLNETLKRLMGAISGVSGGGGGSLVEDARRIIQ